MTDEQLVSAINGVAFLVFWIFLFTGSVTTISRIVYYRVHGFQFPRLLIRDALVIGGFTLSFGLILFFRFAGMVIRESVGLTLITDLPAVSAVIIYVYYELFVIERGHNHMRDRTYLPPE